MHILWQPLRGELGRGELAPVSCCFTKVMMLFWGGGGEGTWVTPCSPMSPAMPSCFMQKGWGGWCVLTHQTGNPTISPSWCRHSSLVPMGVAVPGAARGSPRCSHSRPATPSNSRACIQARDGSKTPPSPVLSLWLPEWVRGSCHRVPSPASVLTGGLRPCALSRPAGIDRSLF